MQTLPETDFLRPYVYFYTYLYISIQRLNEVFIALRAKGENGVGKEGWMVCGTAERDANVKCIHPLIDERLEQEVPRLSEAKVSYR